MTTIYCNFKVLEVSNVETLIVARSCVPCQVALLEYAFLGRQPILPLVARDARHVQWRGGLRYERRGP